MSTPVNIYSRAHHLDMAVAHLSSRRLRAAEREARAVLQLQPADFVAYTALASALRAQRRYREACDVVTTALGHLTQHQTTSHEEYQECWRTALQLRVIRASCLVSLGNGGQAVAELRDLRESGKGTDDYWLITLDLASALYAEGIHDEAQLLCQEAILDAPPENAPHVYVVLGSLAEAHRNKPDAADFYRLVLHGPALASYQVFITSLRGLLRVSGLRAAVSFCCREKRQVLRQLRFLFNM